MFKIRPFFPKPYSWSALFQIKEQPDCESSREPLHVEDELKCKELEVVKQKDAEEQVDMKKSARFASRNKNNGSKTPDTKEKVPCKWTDASFKFLVRQRKWS